MAHDSERSERQALQRKAYGRDGGLTDAEAHRLQELERRSDRPVALPGSAASVATDSAASPTETGPVAAGVLTPHESAEDFLESFISGAEPSPDDLPPRQDTPAPRAVRAAVADLRRHALVVAVASALLLAGGLAAGWALFGRASDGIVLTAEQQQRRLELLDKRAYDEGSLRAVGQDDEGALVWYGTTDGGEQACLVLDVDEISGQQCLPAADASEFLLSANVTVPAEEGAESSDAVGVSAVLVFSTTGEPMVSIQRWTQQADAFLWQFGGEERSRASELLSEHDVMNLSIVGTFLDEPVWLMDRSWENRTETCLIVDAVAGQMQCRPAEIATQEGISMVVFADSEPSGTEAWSVEVAYTIGQTPYLVITRDPSPGSVTFTEYGERFGLEVEDPVAVTPDSVPGG